MRSAILLIVNLLVSVSASAADQPRPLLHPLFSDHAVLQRDATDPVWGWTSPGTSVTVEFAGKTATAVADDHGRWQATVGPLPAGGPFTLTVSSGDQTTTLNDILIGDVWLCSGQSNMEMGIGIAKDAPAEIAAAHHPRLRLFTVQKHVALEPQTLPAGGKWEACTPTTVAAGGWGGFSAVGYYFGRHLLTTLDVPIGLIHSSWGGTPAEAWTSEEALAALPAHRGELAQVDAARAALASSDADAHEREWWKTNDPGTAAAWQDPASDDAAWKEMELPGAWEGKGLPGWDGVVWFRKRLTIPADWAGKELQLDLGPIDDRDTTWFDGVLIGHRDEWNVARSYRIAAAQATAGEHVIAVRVLDTGGAGGIYGRADQLKLAVVGAGAAQPLAGAWRFRETTPLSKLGQPPAGPVNQNSPTVLYDGMIAPLLPFALKGAIWYQGEANVDRAADYRALLPAMIGDWRARFGSGDFPFLIVQLAAHHERAAQPGASLWAELREAQAITARALPKCGLTVAIDIGDAKDIHPKNKQEVGRRLGLAAERVAYGREVEESGPAFKSMTVAEGKARLSFSHLGGGLDATGGKILGFSIAGADGAFVWADAALDGDQVVVSSPQVAEPTKVRYAWADNPEATLINKAGLPAVPFRTDQPAPQSGP